MTWTLALLSACGGDEGRASASETNTTPPLTGTTVEASSSSGETPTTGTPTSGGVEGSSSTGGTSTEAVASSTGGSTESSTGAGPKLDLGVPACPPEDICCLMEGDIPPHKLLEEFLAVYPPANMPKSVAAVQAFEPMAGGHAMAWSDENVGGELVDAGNGGVIEANVLSGLALARAAAEMALPADAKLLEAREDPVIIEDLGGNDPCIGVGWAWGSILFEGVDQSIGELVYLYIGYCSDGDVEVFYYSDQSVEICPPPG
jgi:hypothetical protein